MNPQATTPQHKFSFDNQQLSVAGDKKEPEITCLAVTGGGQVVMADCHNKSVKVLDAGSPASISAVPLLETIPWSLVVCHDGLVAVTSESDYVIRLIDVKGTPRVVRQIKTDRQYWGVECGGVDNTLIVSCEKDRDGPAQLDVITREGIVSRVVVASSKLPDLNMPCNLRVVRDQVLVSDRGANCVWRVNMATGGLLAKHTHPELKSPRQVTADRDGNMYVASYDGHCVLVLGRDKHTWRTLISAGEHGESTWHVGPRGVALSGTRLFVGWSVLKVYELA